MKDDSFITVTLIDQKEPLIMDVDGVTYRISGETSVPKEHVKQLLSSHKIKTIKDKSEKDKEL